MREILSALGLVPRGGNYETVRRRIAELGLNAQAMAKLGVRGGSSQARLKERIGQLGLDVSHFLGEGWRRGVTTPVTPARPLEEFLVGGRLVQTSSLKKRLIAEGLKEERCEICRRKTWNRRPIPLELGHINGRRDDNRLANLRVLCPNCHAQTETYRGRNIGAAEPVS